MRAPREIRETNLDPARLRYVTENFERLQGLNLVVLGILFLSQSIDRALAFPVWLWVIVWLACAAAAAYLRKYYRQRFGWIEALQPSNKKALIFVAAIVLLIFIGPGLGRYFDIVVPVLTDYVHTLFSDPNHRVDLLDPLFWVAYWFFLIARPPEGKYRSAFLVGGVFAWFGVEVVWPLRDPSVTQLTVWKILNAGWISIGIVAIGLYNHFVLVHLMPNRIAGDENER